MVEYGVSQIKTVDGKKYHAITQIAKDSKGQPAVKTIEKRCRAALLNYKAWIKKFKECPPSSIQKYFYEGQ